MKGLDKMSDFENERDINEEIAENSDALVESGEMFTEEHSEKPAESGEIVSEENGEAMTEEVKADTEHTSFAEKSESGESAFTEFSGQSASQDEPHAGAVILTPKKHRKKKASGKAAAILAGAAVICCSVGFGMGAGGYLNKIGGITATSGSDVSLQYGEGAENTPIEYTTNFTSIKDVFDAVEDSIVNISIKVSTTNMWLETVEATGSGSGIIYKIDGDDVYIVTNNHVVENANTVSVSVTGEEQVNATLVGRDVQNDLAVIKVSKADLNAAGVSDVKAVEFVSEDTAEMGETVLAIGNALGDGKSITQGIISAKNKAVKIDNKNLTVIQTDAAVNPGNSGGALVNLDAKVIGINTAKIGGTVVEGTGYAIPSYIAVGIVNQIISNGTVERPYLGVVCFTITDSFKQMYNLDIDGIFVREVEQGSAAEKAGLIASDIITAANGTPVKSQEELQKIISASKVGDTLKIDYIRNGQEKKTVDVILENYNEKF